MLLKDFDFDLPTDRIAQFPTVPRDHSKLLRVLKNSGSITHHSCFELENFISSDDLLIFNNTKVIPARIFATLGDRRFEILLLNRVGDSFSRWKCLVKPGKKMKVNSRVTLKTNEQALIEEGESSFEIVFPDKNPALFYDWLTTVGEPPIPPYLKRPVTEEDKELYQTIYAKVPGSIAAPTAGLHFTETLQNKLRNKGIRFAELTLQIGYGTFAPIDDIHLVNGVLHEEYYEIPPATFDLINETKKRGGRVIAVGTTSLRALESSAQLGMEKSTRLFIMPGYQFKYVDALITNFHLPQSSLFILVCAFLGKELTLNAYHEAIRNHYRFYSYGDAMFISKNE